MGRKTNIKSKEQLLNELWVLLGEKVGKGNEVSALDRHEELARGVFSATTQTSTHYDRLTRADLAILIEAIKAE